MAENTKKCAHSRCSCTAAEDSDYCTAYCENIAETDINTITCECGHSGCQGEILT